MTLYEFESMDVFPKLLDSDPFAEMIEEYDASFAAASKRVRDAYVEVWPETTIAEAPPRPQERPPQLPGRSADIRPLAVSFGRRGGRRGLEPPPRRSDSP